MKFESERVVEFCGTVVHEAQLHGKEVDRGDVALREAQLQGG
jgi:hypothetical protein